ncbi:MAG: hypothetical protein O2944_11395, partial [Proteobacteria bacterium]|nr:hypothetical protein [Pseudomonadota bacterium]
MPMKTESERVQRLIQAAMSASKSSRGKSKPPLAFVAEYFVNVAYQDLEELGAKALAGLAAQHWA